MDQPIPFVDDPDTGGFFAAAAKGELAICFCTSCRIPVHLPRALCHRCYKPTEWRVVSPNGTLATYTVVEQQVHPAFPTPYTVVLVELDDVPTVRLLGRIDGAHDLPIGTPMVATFEPIGDGAAMPNWRWAAVDA